QGGTLNASMGAVLELSNGAAMTGDFTGSGAGRVELSGGNFASSDFGIAGEHATLNFPAGLLRWTGGSISSGGCGSGGGCATTLVNAGSITIEGVASKGIGGTGLINEGSIVNLGSGDFGTGGSVFDNRAGATYEHRGDSNFFGTDQFGNSGRIINAGSFLKTAGAGTVSVTSRLDNTASGVIEVQAGRLQFSRGGNSSGGTFNADAGAVLEFGGNDGFSLNAGSYTGGGLGNFETSAQLFAEGTSGTTFNFPDGFFHWVSSAWFGLFTNDGGVTLASAANKFARATIINNGTFTHMEASELELNPDARFENHGLYEFTGDGDIVVPNSASSGTMMFVNSGVLRKSGGVGVSDIRLDSRHPCGCQDMRFSNTGAVDVQTGSLLVDRPIVQTTGTTLTDGTWIVRDFATLAFHNSLDAANPNLPTPNYTTNLGNVTLDGSQSRFLNIDGLANNQGSFTLDNGRDFTTLGNLANTGSITVGPGSTLTVSGAFSKAGSHALHFEIGGSPASGLFGQINVTGTADLTGALRMRLVDGFGPALGDMYTVMTYPSRIGSAPVIGGLGAFFDAAVTNTTVTLNAIGSTADIAVDPFGAPTSGMVGQDVTINYTVRELDNVAVAGDWTDSIYLSKNDSLSADDKLIGRVPHTGGLAALGMYNGTITAPLPPAADGDYRVLVVADSRMNVADSDRASNTRASSNLLHIDVPTLTVGAPSNGTITNGQEIYFRIDVPAGGGDLVLDATFAVPIEAELFVRQGDIPSPARFDFAANDLADLTRHVVIQSPQAGSYYVLLRGREGAATPQSFMLAARLATFEIRGVGPDHGSNLGSVTITVNGSGFTPEAAVSLVAPGGGTRAATTVRFRDPETLFASFDLAGLGNGAGYDVRIVDTAGTTTAADVFTVTTGAAGRFEFSLSFPRFIRTGRSGEAIVSYSNVGDTDIAAPIMLITGRNANFKLPDHIQFGDEQLEFLAINDSGPAGILPPGAAGQITIQFNQQTTGLHVTSDIQVGVAQVADPIDWTKLEVSLRPSTMQADAWSAIWANVVADFGTTFSQYQGVMAETASYLSTLGVYTADISRLLAFRMRIADDFGAIIGRYALGPYGRGQNDPLRVVAVTEPNGTVSISSPGLVRPFLRLADNSYRGVPGDPASLTRRADGSYRLDELDGSVLSFRTDGLVDFQQDRNGYRTIWGYDGGGRVTTLTEPNGDTIRFAYNAQGRIGTVTDRVGRVTTYAYDNGGAGDHLIQVSSAGGTTRISYITGQGAAREHAVSSIEFPDGTHRNFEYDARGRLIRQTGDSGDQPITFAYDSVGGVTITDAAGNETVVRRNDSGLAGQVVDPLGNVYLGSFDANRQLTNIAQPGGRQDAVKYDAKGNVTRQVDPLGA
ncbi:MAG: hypothetical protein ABI614_11115, partial [Planctomycetota bacterium]